MASIITPLPSAVSRSPIYTGVTGASASINPGEFFFYSNNPESVNNLSLADQNKFLNQISVSGAGQVYVWHRNVSGKTVNACILIHNPNSYAIKVTSSNYGLTKSNTIIPDSVAWESYYNGQSTSKVINANSFDNIFLQSSIANNAVWGIVARLKIERNGTTTAASATLTDFAYDTNSGSANAWATVDNTSRRRGSANGFYTNLSFTLSPAVNANGQAVKFSKVSDSSFSSNEMANITDPSGFASGRLEGSYGQQFKVNATIKNTTGATRKFKIYLGSIGGNSVPFCNFGNSITKATAGRGAGTYTDIIETGDIANNGSELVVFSTVIPATASTTYIIGARTS